MSIVSEYLSLTVKWKKEYGNKTLVLMQVGSFFEVYALQSTGSTGCELIGSNIAEFASLNDMIISKKNVFVDKKQVVMAGFGLPQVDKYVKKLQENGYTVVIYRQDDNQGTAITRSLAEIISPGTYFSADDSAAAHVSNNIMCIWIYASTSKYFSKKTMTIGVANIDIFTGKTTLFQFNVDYSFHVPNSYDELERYVSIYSPSECLFVTNIDEKTTNEIISFIGVADHASDCLKIHRIFLNETDATCNKMGTKMSMNAHNAEKQNYQQEVLRRFYPTLPPESFTSSIMTYYIATQSFVFLLDFIYQHSPNLVHKLSEPVFENHTDKLVLANHSLKQLNILDDERHIGKLRSVSTFLNNCVTTMGRRKFMYNLHNPTTNAVQLNTSYTITAHLLQQSNIVQWDNLRTKLQGIKDLEKLKRRLILHKITPKDFALFVQDLRVICELYENTQKDSILTDYILQEEQTIAHDIRSYCKTMIDELERVFNLEKCAMMHDGIGSETEFINRGVNDTIDTLIQSGVDSCAKLEAIREYLSGVVKSTEKNSAATNSTQFIKIHETPKSDPILIGTSRRVTILKHQLSKIHPEKITSKITSKINIVKLTYISAYTQKEEIFNFDISALTYATVGSNKTDLVITSNEIKQIAEEMRSVNNKLVQEIVLFYNNFVKNEFVNYEMEMESVIRYTTILDTLQCKCYIAYKYNYCQPQIQSSSEKAFLSFTGIRHPLIEHLQTNELYVTNDLAIGNETMTGLLLYGTNAVGKTSFIKSVGIALILAQAGLYVPCETFIYKPYTCIFTRILGNDNLFKGLSTFAVEMSELRTILTQANENSLVLGDELCSGTESDSALSIFTAGLETLHKKNSTFLFATHFHEIIKYEEIKTLNKLKMMHMTVIYNVETNTLVYDRRLKAGAGDSMYGLEVCKSLNLPPDFLQRAHDIRMKYKPESRNILSLETSQYNAKKIVGGLCEICASTTRNKATEVHHLQHQKNAKKEKNEYIGSFHKNHPANLVNICEECHQKIHTNKNQHKIVKTTKGYKLVAI